MPFARISIERILNLLGRYLIWLVWKKSITGARRKRRCHHLYATCWQEHVKTEYSRCWSRLGVGTGMWEQNNTSRTVLICEEKKEIVKSVRHEKNLLIDPPQKKPSSSTKANTFFFCAHIWEFYVERSTDVVPLPLKTQFPSRRRKGWATKSQYWGVRYFPPPNSSDIRLAVGAWWGRLVHRVDKHHTLNLRQPPPSADIGSKRGGVAQNYTDKPPIHRWNL